MTLPYKSYITADDILKYKGYRLDKVLATDHSGSTNETIEHFLLEVASVVYNCVLETCNRQEMAEFICTSEDFENLIARCQLEQAVYILENSNLLSMANLKEGADIKEIRKVRSYSPLMLNELKASRIFFGGRY